MFSINRKAEYTNVQSERVEKEPGKLSDKHNEINNLIEKGLKKPLGLDLRYLNGTIE